MNAATALRCAVAVARRPALWRTAARQLRVTAPNGWFRRKPFLPVPTGGYLTFRLVTQYGSADHRIDTADVLNYLTWCKRQHTSTAPGH